MSPGNRALCYFSAFLLLSFGAAAQTAPRYPKPVEKQRPPTGPDGKPLVTIDGRWYSDFGFMDLSQTGWSFQGIYSCCGGEIRGEFLADQIEFFWQDPVYGNGWGYFRLQDEAQRLVGVWGTEADMGSAGAWRAVRLVEREYEGEPTRYRFATHHPQLGEITGEAMLYFAGERVAGWMTGSSTVPSETEGRSLRHEVHRQLEGSREGDEIVLEWLNPLTERRGEIRLGQRGETLDGLWRITEEIVEPITLTRLAGESE